MPRPLLALLLLLAALGASGCGAEDGAGLGDRLRAEVEERRERIEQRIEEARAQARLVGDQVRERVREALADLEQVVPEAGEATRPPTVRGGGEPTTIDRYLTEVLTDVDRYWTRTLAENGLEEPRVGYVWVPPRSRARTACGATADDQAAFYCPADDTIYVGQVLAAEVYEGIARGFPGQSAGYGRAVGDFGVAYLVAHEYAHNLQQELGFFSRQRRGDSARPFELQADCLAGAWGNSAYQEGRVTPEDVEEALGTALAVGDFEVGSEQHHGTPEQRRNAWLLGFETGRPAVCGEYVGV